ncbi:mechanosensitive ion channel family protein [Halioxenophilus aromaticivorans]|uniref:Small-conductance mechanosensitive channel n=1 Tax=Halioxenophilus aromaticivorans TaxID=1306992 RepID=A0AAV3UA31_9ALTE
MDTDKLNIGAEVEKLSALYDLIIEFLVTYSFQLLGAVIVLIIGLFIAGRLSKRVEKLLLARKFDVTLSRFIANMLRVAIVIMVAVIVLNKLGVNITPMVAAIGALSLGAGLAVQGLLTNYSAGLNIIITRPYVVGDTITLLGVTGVVTEVRMAATLLTNEDDEIISIPNRHIIGEIITNSKDCRVVELEIGIAYRSDVDKACRVIGQALASVDGNNPKPAKIGIDSFGDSAVVLGVRFWTPTQQYFEQKYKSNAEIFKALVAAEIEIPFPQREITLLNSASQKNLPEAQP